MGERRCQGRMAERSCRWNLRVSRPPGNAQDHQEWPASQQTGRYSMARVTGPGTPLKTLQQRLQSLEMPQCGPRDPCHRRQREAAGHTVKKQKQQPEMAPQREELAKTDHSTERTKRPRALTSYANTHSDEIVVRIVSVWHQRTALPSRHREERGKHPRSAKRNLAKSSQSAERTS